MLELPETITMAAQLEAAMLGKTVSHVLPPTKIHKFCWYQDDVMDYDAKLKGQSILFAQGFGIYAELVFDKGSRLCFNDGVNVRLINEVDAPKAYQLLIGFTDGSALVFTVAMYGGIILHEGDYDNEYYVKSKQALTPFIPEFETYFKELLDKSKESLSMKAFLATEQRFPGIGNGVVQDILFKAGLHPKRKLGTLSNQEKEILLSTIRTVLSEMKEKGGRDTEKDLFGREGGYRTKMSKKSLNEGCPVCGGPITKEAFLGGSVYYCEHCQPLVK